MSAKSLLFTKRNLALSLVSLCVPSAVYVSLVDKRMKRRLPLVLRDELPPALAEPPRFGIHPKLNYVEGWYADVPKKWFCNRAYMKEFARVFWLQNALLDLEQSFLGLLNKFGIEPYEKRGTEDCKRQVVEGKELCGNIFHVEEVTPHAVKASYWFRAPDKLLGGVHTLAVEENASQDRRLVRVWFVSHFALNIPNDRVEPGPRPALASLQDPSILQAEDGYFPKLLWFHRFYARYLLDWTLGRMHRNHKDFEEEREDED